MRSVVRTGPSSVVCGWIYQCSDSTAEQVPTHSGAHVLKSNLSLVWTFGLHSVITQY